MKKNGSTFVRKTVTMGVDIMVSLDEICIGDVRKNQRPQFRSRIVNEIVRASNFKNLEKYAIPRDTIKKTRATLVVDMDNHQKIIDYTANSIEKCALTYCGEPSKSYSGILNQILRKELHL